MEFKIIVKGKCAACGKEIQDDGFFLCKSCRLLNKDYKQTESEKSKSCDVCIVDGTDACPRGAGRAVDSDACDDFVGDCDHDCAWGGVANCKEVNK